jgi:hypothetical protein
MWIEAGKFIFRGTDVLGIPTTAKIIVKSDARSKAAIELYDEINREVVARWADIINREWQIKSAKLSNLPESESIFLVRGQTDANYLYLAELMIEF